MTIKKTHIAIISFIIAAIAVLVYGSTSPVLLKGGFIVLYFFSLIALFQFKEIKITAVEEESAEFDLNEDSEK